MDIFRLSSRGVNCYLIRDEGLVLVDGGMPNTGSRLLKQLRDSSIEPEDVTLLFVTHGHWDHIGSASQLKAATGCKVAINHREKDWLEQGLKVTPPGVGLWGKVMALFSRVYSRLVKFPGAAADLVLEDEDFSLEPFGIHGKLIHTPGHTAGSMSLLLDSGEAFVGDLAMNGLPLRLGPGMPAVAEDTAAVKESWRLLLDRGATWIYPAHGKPFKAEILEKKLSG
ncbi:MAG: MBL fold metallo-hydrolase [Chloroflexi bacterium]|nr:MBL fold metallo-hydrolase [Chloroflexota bacterium]